MTEFYKAKEQPVEWYATKYDACILRATGKAYRFQKGSGRSEVLTRFAADGKTLGDIAKEAAAAGFDPSFTISSIFKHHDTPDGAYVVEAPEGTTLEAIKKQRQERRVSPEIAAKREAAAQERANKIAEREAKKAEREAAAAAKIAEREAAKAKAEEERQAKLAAKEAAKAEREAAKAAAGAKPKGKGKGKANQSAGEAEAQSETQDEPVTV